MQVFLIRHPRPLVAAGLCYGRLDVACEDPGPIAERLRGEIPAGTPIVCSPLRRARCLAEALAPEVTVDARLREIDFGTWEGRPWNDIDREALDAWAADILNYVPPGGESVAALRERVLDFACSLTVPRVAIVAHAGVLRTLVGHWRALPTAEWTTLPFAFGSLTRIEL